MIEAFTKAWFANLDFMRQKFLARHPDNYYQVVRAVVEMLSDSDGDDDTTPDPDRIHQIDDGDDSGTLVYVIGGRGHQPRRYWYVKLGYGSCTLCDTLQTIRGYGKGPPTTAQMLKYMTLALHVVQGLREMDVLAWRPRKVWSSEVTW